MPACLTASLFSSHSVSRVRALLFFFVFIFSRIAVVSILQLTLCTLSLSSSPLSAAFPFLPIRSGFGSTSPSHPNSRLRADAQDAGAVLDAVPSSAFIFDGIRRVSIVLALIVSGSWISPVKSCVASISGLNFALQFRLPFWNSETVWACARTRLRVVVGHRGEFGRFRIRLRFTIGFAAEFTSHRWRVT